MSGESESTALLVIDLQRGLESPSHGPRNNPDCETNVAALIQTWREKRQPVVFVRHDSSRPDSLLRPGQPGNDFHPVVDGEPDLLVAKQTSSAFQGDPDLHAWLQERQVQRVAICGVQTNYCCESTARAAADLGYDTLFVIDATYTFDLTALDGGTIPATELARVTASTLHGEIADVVTTADLLSSLTFSPTFVRCVGNA